MGKKENLLWKALGHWQVECDFLTFKPMLHNSDVDAEKCYASIPLKLCFPHISHNIFFGASNGPGHAKMCLMPYANNKGADQPAHPRSLISTLVCVRCLDSLICILTISKLSRV